jgi:ATP-dependent Clp protease, protease subunit
VQNKNIPSPFTIGSATEQYPQHPALAIQLTHLIEYFGIVNYSTNERILNSIKDSLIRDPEVELTLLVTSAGGPSGTAMSFYDTVRHVLRPRLTTIGSGDVDSSGVILFLTGTTRFVTPHTTMLLHPAGRQFEPGKRFTAEEVEAMTAEDRMKDDQYASIVAANSSGKLTKLRVLELMQKQTVLTPDQIVGLGLAQEILR